MTTGATKKRPGADPPSKPAAPSVAELPRIQYEEILAGDRILSWLTNSVGFSDWRKVISLVLAITFPFLLFSFVADQEGRFSLKSLTFKQQIGQEELEVLGMSFLGDPMVWPFFILVPLTILLLKHAAQKLADFFYEIRVVVDPAWAQENAGVYEQLIRETRDRLDGRGTWRWAPRAAAGIAIAFWLWNGATCTIPQLGAYQSASVYVQQANEWTKRDLDNRLNIQKWDANFTEAPFCWGLARLWTLFGYGVVPFILAKLFAIVTALSLFSKALIKKGALNIQPLAADRSGGLSCLTDAALAIIYTFLPVLLMVFAAFFKEGTPPSTHNYLLMAAFLPLIMIAFGVPVGTVHAAMEKTKRKYLARVSHRFNVVNQELLRHLENAKPDREHIQTLDRSIQALQNLYSQIEKMPVWPLEIGRGLRFAGALLAPVALTLAQLAAEPLVMNLFAG